MLEPEMPVDVAVSMVAVVQNNFVVFVLRLVGYFGNDLVGQRQVVLVVVSDQRPALRPSLVGRIRD